MRTVIRLQTLVRDVTAQDMAEYALLAGFLAVIAGMSLPPIQRELGGIFFWLREYLLSANS